MFKKTGVLKIQQALQGMVTLRTTLEQGAEECILEQNVIETEIDRLEGVSEMLGDNIEMAWQSVANINAILPDSLKKD